MDSPGASAPALRPLVDPDTHEVTFRVPADHGAVPRRVWFHLKDYGADPTFRREGDHWVARIPRPPVDRLEYLLVLQWPDGGESMVPDPANPHRIRTVFGDKSVIEFPGYTRPWWLAVADATDAQDRRDAQSAAAALRRALGSDQPRIARRTTSSGRVGDASLVPVAFSIPGAPAGLRTPPGEGIASVRGRSMSPGADDRARRAAWASGTPRDTLVAEPAAEDIVDPEADVAVTGQLHVPANSTPTQPLPLLVVHDGPEYADLAQLLRYVTTITRLEPDLRCRVLLLAPVDRDRSYSASPAYARALVTGMLPQVTSTVATSGRPIGVGSSLGGLAMLHAAVTYPGSFAGVFSQSGSFFRPRTDGMERGFRFYQRTVRFVDDIVADPERLAGLHVSMTCGTGEENLANNRSLARRLRRAGVPTELTENPDGHNHTGWRDCLDPGLRILMRTVWDRAGNTPT